MREYRPSENTSFILQAVLGVPYDYKDSKPQ